MSAHIKEIAAEVQALLPEEQRLAMGAEALRLLLRGYVLVDSFQRRPGITGEQIRDFMQDVESLMGIRADRHADQPSGEL